MADRLTLISVRTYSSAAMIAAEDVTQLFCRFRRITFRLTSSHSGAIPDSCPVGVRELNPAPVAGSSEVATTGVIPREAPEMMPATWLPWPRSSVSGDPAPTTGPSCAGATR